MSTRSIRKESLNQEGSVVSLVKCGRELQLRALKLGLFFGLKIWVLACSSIAFLRLRSHWGKWQRLTLYVRMLDFVLPHLACKISEARLQHFQWLSLYSHRLSFDSVFSINFNHFQSLQSYFQSLSIIFLDGQNRQSPIASDFGSRTQIAALFAVLLYQNV